MSEKYHKIGIDKKFIRYIILISYATAFSIFVILYFCRHNLPAGFAGGFLTGAVCGITNLYLLNIFIRSTIVVGRTRAIPAVIGGLGGMGFLGGFLYVFSKRWFNDSAMVTGFTFVFVIIVVVAVYLNLKEGSSE